MSDLRNAILDLGAVLRLATLASQTEPNPAPATDAGEERLRAYHLALGKFVSDFATTELLMHFVLKWHTKTTAVVARSVFSGVRTHDAAGFLRRLAETNAIAPEEWAELLPVIDQLRIINDLRNQILHHGVVDIESGNGVVSNEALALTIDRITQTPISAEIMEDVIVDLQKINVHLLMRHMGRQTPQPSSLEAVLTASWRYTPPPQSQNRSHQGERRTRRGRPRSASRE